MRNEVVEEAEERGLRNPGAIVEFLAGAFSAKGKCLEQERDPIASGEIAGGVDVGRRQCRGERIASVAPLADADGQSEVDQGAELRGGAATVQSEIPEGLVGYRFALTQ